MKEEDERVLFCPPFLYVKQWKAIKQFLVIILKPR